MGFEIIIALFCCLWTGFLAFLMKLLQNIVLIRENLINNKQYSKVSQLVKNIFINQNGFKLQMVSTIMSKGVWQFVYIILCFTDGQLVSKYLSALSSKIHSPVYTKLSIFLSDPNVTF